MSTRTDQRKSRQTNEREKKKHKEIKVLKKSKYSPEGRDVGVCRPKRGISVPERRLEEGKKDAM